MMEDVLVVILILMVIDMMIVQMHSLLSHLNGEITMVMVLETIPVASKGIHVQLNLGPH